MRRICLFLGVWLIGGWLISGTSYAQESPDRMVVALTDAPQVPPPIERAPTKVVVNLETKEIVGRLADGVEYRFWTFGSTVPGPFIRIKQGDEVELNLKNNGTNRMFHNIALQAVTGHSGGAAATLAAPGQRASFKFTALNPGLYVYYCTTPPIGIHMANGMYGLILVEPKEGLPPVDREYYVVQSEFYTSGKKGEKGLQGFSLEKAMKEEPEYVVFNGAVGAIGGENTLRAQVGETVRLFVGNAGPNLTSSFHIIGEIFDRVYGEGGSTINQQNVQTTLIPAGGATIVEFKVEVPGDFFLVDHSIFRAFHRGTMGILNVEGDENPNLYSGLSNSILYTPKQQQHHHKMEKGTPVAEMMMGEVLPPPRKMTRVELLQRGQEIYENQCSRCHQADGQGKEGKYPPLARSSFLMSGRVRAIDIVLNGLSGEIEVNGQKYNGVMHAQQLSDEDTASVLTYVRNSWGNSSKEITPENVRKIRNLRR